MSLHNMVEINYFSLSCQGSVYSKTILEPVNSSKKLMVSSLKKKVSIFEFFETTEDVLIPSTKELSFSYSPNGAEIISTDAFNRSVTCDDFVLGITFNKVNIDGSHESWLNIYSETDLVEGRELDVESTSQNCCSQELKFMPYQLTHTYVLNGPSHSKEIVWLLCGGDEKIHMFMEDYPNRSYVEADLAEYLPELGRTSSITMNLDIRYNSAFSRRFSALGFENGVLEMYIVEAQSNQVLSTVSEFFLYPVNCVLFFTMAAAATNQTLGEPNDESTMSSTRESNCSSNDLHLVACPSYGLSVVYMHVESDGFTRKHCLESSDGFDLVTSCCAADVDLDGSNELLLGTFGERVIAYKYDTSGEGWIMAESPLMVGDSVQCVQYTDLDGDTIPELVIHSVRGVRVFQHKPQTLDKIFHIPTEVESSVEDKLPNS